MSKEISLDIVRKMGEKLINEGGATEETIKRSEERVKEHFDNYLQRLIQDRTDYIEVCAEFIKEQPVYFDNAGLFWLWNNRLKRWEIKDEIDILNSINKAFEWGGITNQSLRSQFLTALKMVARDNEPRPAPKEWIQFKNKIINYVTGEEIEPNPNYFLTNPLPYNLGDSEETPIIDKLFYDWAGNNAIKLYEIIAYCLLKDYPIQRIMVLLGSGSNGKGSFLRFLRKLLGIDNITSTDLDKISKNRFETAKMFKKLVCEIAETNVTILRYTSTLKRLSGGDLIDGEFKNKNPFTFENYAKLLIATNSLPITDDKTDGFYRRFLIVEFKNKFKDGKEITNEITDKEYSNLARKLVRILRELMNRGLFTNEETIEERKKRYEALSNPLIPFIEFNYDKDVNSYVDKSEFRDSLKKFLQDGGYRMLNDKEITSALKIMGYESKQKKIEGYPYWVIYGLREKVTRVTGVTDNLTQFSNTRNYIENAVTGVTAVTLINENQVSDSIIKIIKSGHNEESDLIELLEFNKVSNKEDTLSVLRKLLSDGVIFEPKAGLYKLTEGR